MLVTVAAISLVLLLASAILYYRGKALSDALMALGLAFFVIAFVLLTTREPTPPEPPIVNFGGYRPHYQGHGVNTKGGRGGQIFHVNSADSLKKAVAASGPRIIVFDVSGNMDLGGQLSVTNPFLTIAGQTAPDGGITLIHTRFLIDTNDVVVQHVKVRLPPPSLNACSIGDAGDGGDNSHVFNIVYDHVTCTWSKDVNNLLVAGPGSHDIAILDSFIGEGLWTGALGGIGGGIGYKNTVARTVFSNHWSRQFIYGSPGELAGYNNISYNGTNNSYGYDTLPALYGDADGDGSAGAKEEVVLMNNVTIAGPDSGQIHAFLGISKKQASIDAGSKTYLEGNQGPGIAGSTPYEQWVATVCEGSYGNYTNAATCGPTSNMRTDTLFPWWVTFKFVLIPTGQVLDKVLANAGSRPKNRDAADNRMIADIQNRTGTHYLDTKDVTLPDILATTRVCSLPSDPDAVMTYLESDPTCGAQRLEVR